MDGRYVHLPAAADRVWFWFWQLDRTRNGNGYSAFRITFQDISHMASLTGVKPEGWEISAILQMDAVRLSLLSGEPSKPTSARKMTPALFGAVFGGD